jgi:hopanoid C-3 methylase HpnR
MKVLAVHPSSLMYTEIYLRLEPLGLELVAEAARRDGHEVRIIDLQVETHSDLSSLLDRFRPDLIVFSGNYLANVPEIIDLARMAKERRPHLMVAVGGHSATFVAREMLHHARGSIDCILKGEGEPAIRSLLRAIERGSSLTTVPGALTLDGEGPQPELLRSIDELFPARDLLRRRRKYYIGVLDPCASIEFSRGCPWDCSFCSAWTFYGRSYRAASPEKAVEDLAGIKESGVFIVDDVAFIQAKHGMEIGEAIARRGIKKRYYLETRGDVLLRNKEVFALWRRLGLEYMFLGIEAIDEEGLKKYRKRTSPTSNFEALEYARSLGIGVAINLIVDPDWDERRFRIVREWCQEVPEIVNLSVNTPYPGTETWHTESRRLITRDYRLFDIQHVVLPTRLPLGLFYRELVRTQELLNKKHLGWAGLRLAARLALGHLLRGQTNFVSMLWRFNRVFNPDLQIRDHYRPVRYEMDVQPDPQASIDPRVLYVHRALGRRGRQTDEATEAFVDDTRMKKDAS